MPRTTNLLLVLTIALWSFAACSGDPVSDGADTTSPPIDIPEHECGFDAECDGKFTDLAPCEDAVCEAGTCVKQIRGTWASCDHPDAGECDGGYCDQSGDCVLRSADDGTPCGEAGWTNCTVGECQDGGCIDVVTVTCDDDNPCTDDACEPATGDCTNTNNTVPCDDFNECTGNDTCSDGECHGADNSCQCEIDADCDAFDDGDKCNGILTCVDKICVPLEDSEVTCGDLEDTNSGCLVNACNADTGECEPTPSEDYIPCDDGDGCTGCGPDETDCTTFDFCSDGNCVAGNGAPCEGCLEDADCAIFDDGDLCNGLWACTEGTCAPAEGTEVACSEPTNCATFACEPASGECLKTYISCSEVYEPVCGTDGLSYANTCQAECNGQTEVAATGLCASGALTCSELLNTCSAECIGDNFSDWTCLSSCGEQGTEEALELIIEASICALDADCLESSEDNQAFIDCATAACPDEVAACQADVPCEDAPCETCVEDADCIDWDDGDLCNGVWTCTDGACAEDADSAVTCSEPTNCATFACEPTTGECVTSDISCSEVYEPVCGTDGLSYANTCQAECDGQTEVAATGLCASGALTCSELLATCSAECIGNDFSDWTCLSTCGEQGAEEAVTLIIEASICALAAGCLESSEDNQAFIDCATAACPTEVAACEADAPCVPAVCGAEQCGAVDDGCESTIDCGGCGDGFTCTDNACVEDAAPLVTYVDTQPIYAAKCAGCHTGDGNGGHDIGSVYADSLLMAGHASCTDMTIAECSLVRIDSGHMPLGGGCASTVPDDDTNAAMCITETEYATIEQWIADGTLEAPPTN